MTFADLGLLCGLMERASDFDEIVRRLQVDRDLHADQAQLDRLRSESLKTLTEIERKQAEINRKRLESIKSLASP